MRVSDVPTMIETWEQQAERPWWVTDAILAYRDGRIHPIPNRNDDGLYLARFWITEPSGRDGGDIESGSSVLLHYFQHGDDDAALHDHPWSFTTRVLVGGYDEHLPPESWRKGDELGPAWDQRIVHRATGARVFHHSADLHCVGRALPGTWTMVVTGPRERDWGFHPPGQRWQHWRDFLGRKKPALAASA